MWVKTCFLGKGLSPSKLSTKALCGDTRKTGSERPQRQRLGVRIRFPGRPGAGVASGSTNNRQRVNEQVTGGGVKQRGVFIHDRKPRD